MIESTGETYQSAQFAKSMFVAEAKVGKTCFEVAACLGALPWQKRGGIVDKPQNLHLITFDANAAGGLREFLLNSCGAKEEALKFTIWNLQEDARKVAVSKQEYDFSLLNTYFDVLQRINDRTRTGVPVVIVSSLTGFAQSLQRGISGPPGNKRGGGMDQSKWESFAQSLTEVRNLTQQDTRHVIWEAHVYKPPSTGQSGEARPETMQISGKSGQGFALNVEQVFRIRRQYGTKYEGTQVDRVYLDTQPTMDFIANGRKFNELLNPQEPCPTKAFDKLGLKVGGWGAPPMKVKAVK